MTGQKNSIVTSKIYKMKKFFGTLLLVIGLLAITVSSNAAAKLDCERNRFYHEARYEIDNSYQSTFDSQETAFLFVGGFGLIIFITGLILVVTKTGKQRQLESELTTLRFIAEHGVQSSGVSELEHLFQLKQKGILTEEEFSKAKRKILG